MNWRVIRAINIVSKVKVRRKTYSGNEAGKGDEHVQGGGGGSGEKA